MTCLRRWVRSRRLALLPPFYAAQSLPSDTSAVCEGSGEADHDVGRSRRLVRHVVTVGIGGALRT
jgi:hypothetical protein